MMKSKFIDEWDSIFVKAFAEYMPSGSYPAITGGSESRFKVGTHEYLAKFDLGVRGINIPDTISVTKDRGVISHLLGKCVKLDLIY